MKIWWLTTLIWLMIFASIALWLTVREVDAAGVVQTPFLKMIALGVLGVAGLFVFLVQLVFLYFVKK